MGRKRELEEYKRSNRGVRKEISIRHERCSKTGT